MDVAGFMSTHRKPLLAGFFILLLVFLATLPLYGRVYDIRLVTTILMYIILSVSWVMFSGSTGYMSLAPAAFVGVGVYTTGFLQNILPFPVIIPIGGLFSFILAVLVGLITLRLRGIYFTIFTFGLVMFMKEIVAALESDLFGRVAQHINPLPDETIFYAMLLTAVTTLLAINLIRRSRLGLATLSIGGNEEAAAHMGVDTTRVKVLTFAISAVFMGAAGVILAPIKIYVDPRIAFSLNYSFMPILMAVFGGMGQFYGPVVGAAVFAYLEKTLRDEFATYFMLGFGVILVVVILFMPNGIAGLVSMVRGKLGGVRSKLGKGGEAGQHANT
jgi:branched-chain amino acid transport system permease protein